jgi:hypothetical protein
MKNILNLLAFFIASTFSWALSPPITEPSPIPLGPKMVVWALGQVHDGTLSVAGNGVTSSPYYEIDLRSARTLEQMLGFFDMEGISLQYKNPDAYTITTGEIRDVNGAVLFRAEHWWKLIKTVSDDGLKVSYSVPDWAGNLWFQLQDIQVPFDGESVTVHLSDGAMMTLDVFEGKVSLPGMLSWSEGTVEVVQNGKKSFFDIESGAQVSNTRILARTQGIGLDSIEQIPNSGMSVDVWTYVPYGGYVPVYETVPGKKGMFTIQPKVNDPWSYDSQDIVIEESWIKPLGVWYAAPDKSWKYMKYPVDAESVQIPVVGGQSLYFYFEWDESVGKG